jgi:hypothetical protein
MSLQWDLQEVTDFKELCFIPDTIDESGVIHPDRVKLNPITDVLIWGSMSIGVSKITKKNYTDVHRRYKMLEEAGVCFLTGGKTDDGNIVADRNPSLTEIYLHIGLQTSVSKITNTVFLRKIGETVEDKARFRIGQETKTFNDAQAKEETHEPSLTK